ncbi:hypothetical protein [Chamaesiphon minutus]|uniref:Uncharacterized protein n=1 Tax=Chamaesiphon minutus (strain ATCC 27169 / PCC 6605) TaxID=1173020 RepID=K9UEB9_CHAP6|nr:hypothetical protein [Chamaesiphon minutus]AFY92988.1 hypothetical protein Cha6605_1877 [Chamaesiphon minutus PCC 6605]
MDGSTVTGLEIYRKLEQERYDYLTLTEQKVIRLGAAAIACQNGIKEYKKLGQTDNFDTMKVMLEDFRYRLEIAIAQLPEDNIQ